MNPSTQMTSDVVMWAPPSFRGGQPQESLTVHISSVLSGLSLSNLLVNNSCKNVNQRGLRAGFSFFQLTNQLVNCQLTMTGGLS